MPSRASATTAAPVAAIQRSAGMVFIQSITAKPASSGAANAMPQPSIVDRRSCHGRTIAPGIGREESDDADDGEEEEDERQGLAHEAGAEHERGRLTASPRRTASGRRLLRRVATPGQTSITIGRIIGRRFVRWWK